MKKIFGVLIGLITGAVLAQGITSPPNLRQQFRQLPQIHGGSRLQPSFAADFSQGSITARGATPTFTRATTATVVDQDSIVRNVLSGEARFQGLRRVRNFIGHTESTTGWTTSIAGTGVTPTITAGQTAPDGTATAIRIQASIPGGSGSNSNVSIVALDTSLGGQTNIGSVWMKSTSGASQVVYFRYTANTYGHVVDSTWRRYTSDVGTGISQFQIGTRGGTLVAGYGGQTAATESVDVLIWHPSQEDVTGQAVQIPGEYVSSGVLSSPFHGANVDGVRYFPTYNGNVVQQNNYTFSEDFSDASWTKLNGSVVTNVAISPNGTLTADKFVEDGTNNFHRIQKGSGSILGNHYVVSIYAKAAERRYLNIDITDSTTGGVFAYFDLQAGVISQAVTNNGSWSAGTARITSVGNGWYRCELSGRVGAGTTVSPVFFMSNSPTGSEVATYTGDGVSGIYFWGAQFQTGRRASTYVSTTNVTVNNNIVEEASGDLIPATTRLGYLSEGARTNISLQSEDYTNATWTKVNASTISSGTVATPAGVLNTLFLVEDSTNNQHFMQQSFVKAASSLTYTMYVFAKPSGRNFVGLRMDTGAGANGFRADCDISGISAAAPVALGVGWSAASAKATAYPNGWVKCELTATSDTATDLRTIVQLESASGTVTYLGNGTSSIAFWGAQLEQASFSSSYIPTTTVAVTRNADTLSYPTTAWLNTTIGTWFAQLQETSGSGADVARKTVVATGSGTGAWPIYELWSGAGVTFVADIFDGTTEITGGGAFTPGTTKKIANAYGGATATVARDTVLGVDTAFDGVMNDSGTLSIGSRNDGTTPYFGTLANVKFYPRRLTNPQLQSLTQ